MFQKLTSWFQLPDGKWELGTILPTSGNEKLISLAEGKVSAIFHFLNIIFCRAVKCIIL